ncbi:hypothetical protein GGX14DRAFT_613080, partial [Mycena pura]
MPVSTLSAAFYITPVVLRTFARHGKRLAARGSREEEALDDILFDERLHLCRAFHIVKAFIKLATLNTVESLQKFTNTHVPAPFWAAVAAVCISFHSCNDAADILIEWFGSNELKSVVGGERWWQVRGLDGVDGEWITQKEFLSDEGLHALDGRKLSDDERIIQRMESLDRVLLYVHGGGYFWGSINTHRYQLIRYARTFQGRVFAVNYRKAPQYPWPCPLQDVLAAYLYLIRPPPNAVHKAIPASKIVLAGDSAGGGLCVSVLSILRDMGLPLPAGAVLISPWVDLTHSLPSIMQNVESDIIPEHGFLAKPSTLWPVDPLPPGDGRIASAKNDVPPEPGHADQLRPSKARVQGKVEDQGRETSTFSSETDSSGAKNPEEVNPNEYDIDHFEPRPPKVQMTDPDAVPLELHAQIQLYATNEQLTHPLVSPILQGSLGNLPPLYILAGNGEVLRDEIVYIAHRAAYPEKYPARKGALRDAHRQQENAKLYTTSTKVHLQVFDDMCHVLTVFTFTESAKHAYRSIGAFIKHVTDGEQLACNPFPELQRPVMSGTVSFPSKEDTLGAHLDPASLSDSSADQSQPNTPSGGNVENPGMLRERVSIKGIARPMEPADDMAVLNLKPAEIGIIKEAPTIRWFKGQEEWDKRYTRHAERAMRKKEKNRRKAQTLIAHAKEQGLLFTSDPGPEFTPDSASVHPTDGIIQNDRRWGPLDLDEERPPPTAIAKRRDTASLALLKKHIYHTAPATHRTIPKLKLSDAIKAALDPNDDPNKPPKQSVSEAQVRNTWVPDSLHGLRIWDVLVGYFMRKSAEKAVNGKEAIKKAVSS